MKKLYLPLFLLLTALTITDLSAQKKSAAKLYLRNGTLLTTENIDQKAPKAANLKTSETDHKRLLIIQFNEIPDEDAIGKLKNAGIELLEYVPDNAYTATVSGTLDYALLKQVNARSVIDLEPEQKIQPEILNNDIPGHAINEPGKVDVRVSYAQSFSFEEVSNDLANNNMLIISDALKTYEILEIRVSQDSIIHLAKLPWVQYIELIPAPAEALNDKSTAGTKANVLHSLLPSGYNLTGKGVFIGISDFASISDHIDISSRMIPNGANGQWHGTHVAGIAAGAGLLNEKFKGYAPGASVAMYNSLSSWREATSSVSAFDLALTINTYTSSSTTTCGLFGYYGSQSYVFDSDADMYPSLLNVFAAGNSGAISCPEFPLGLGNVLGQAQSAKNTISVGQTTIAGVISGESSKGPTSDGRIKPDITAPGTTIYSTFPVNRYGAASGTSMAAPAVGGGLALLYQRYRQLHHDENPRNALMKALLLNGATDKGLPGPDYSYGFGSMNLLRSVKMLDRQSYMNGIVGHEESDVHEVTVPANTALLKVMLYWNDPAPSLLSGDKTLVNDLDLTASKQGSAEILPSFPSYAAAQSAASPGVDSVNNAEQIVIEKPETGTYTLKVNGRKIPMGSQEYFLVYDIIETATTITYPVGSEHLTKGDVINICWDSYGNPNSTFGLYYSLNNGDTWTTINASVPAGSTQWGWTVPDGATGLAKVRIVQNATGVTNESGTFTIIGVPVISLSSVQCETYIAAQWTAVAGATDYEVMILKGEEMKSVATTTSLKYVFTSLSKDSTYFISVRARKNGIPGRRALAISRKPDNGTCEGSISDNDLKIEAILTPISSGRMLTSTSLPPDQKIKIRIKNLDDQATNQPLQVGYAIGNEDAPVHWETVASGIDKLDVLDYTFDKTANMQKEGTYPLTVFVKMAGDHVEKNNSVSIVLKQLTNPAITLPYQENFDSWPKQQVESRTIGLNGDNKFDFVLPFKDGRLRTYVEPGLGYGGGQALTIDAGHWGGYTSVSNLDATFNLSHLNVNHDDIRLTFKYKQHDDRNPYADKVLIRGKDTDPWILAFTYPFSDKTFNSFNIEISDLLAKNAQGFSTSFQIRWEVNAARYAPADGLTLDDIRIFRAENDLEIISIVPPVVLMCSVYEAQNYEVTIRNNGLEDCYNVPVQFKVNNETFDTQTIGFVRRNSDSTYVLRAHPDAFSGEYMLGISIEKALDTKPENNFKEVNQTIGPVISTFPYLENFENGTGGWQSSGTNNSWQFGHPGSPKVKEAASGQNAWKTNLNASHNSDELSYLYSPCFQTGWLSDLNLSFSMSLDLEECLANDCDVFYVEYYSGEKWVRLGSPGSGTNWYNKEKNGSGHWSVKDYTRWHVATIPIPLEIYYLQSLRFRFVFKSNAANNREGIAIDDIHIYQRNWSIHDDQESSQFFVQTYVSGDSWFPLSNYYGIAASINPNNQNLGTITSNIFYNRNETRVSNKQYYLDRSFKITADNVSFAEPVKVRLYVADSEIERLIAAPDNTGVDKPKSAYELSITKYSGVAEDGDLLNDEQHSWSFFPRTAIAIVPYDRGYYFEFETKSFSEFWLAKDYIGLGPKLPVELVNFSAKKQSGPDKPDYVLLEWETASEKVFSHFEIEVAVGDENLKQNKFDVIGKVYGQGNGSVTTSYTFTDQSIKHSLIRYYRLKMVDIDQSVRYSSIRSVNFDEALAWQIFPNPSKGKFNVEFRAKTGEHLVFDVFDMNGKLVKNATNAATGNVQKQEIDLSAPHFPSGLYLIRAVSAAGEQTFKVIKE